jgi:hypothetical protein
VVGGDVGPGGGWRGVVGERGAGLGVFWGVGEVGDLGGGGGGTVVWVRGEAGVGCGWGVGVVVGGEGGVGGGVCVEGGAAGVSGVDWGCVGVGVSVVVALTVVVGWD